MWPGILLCAAITLGQPGEPELPRGQLEAPVPTAPPPAPPDRWLLMKSLQGTWPGWILDQNRVQISGWTDVSATASSDRISNLPLGFNLRANDILLQQNWVRIDQPVVTSGTSEPTWGFRFDAILPGSDYRFTTARGLFSGQLTANNGQPNLYGIDPIQFYAEAHVPTIAEGMDIKVGRFFALIGAEDNDAPSNMLWSHSYCFIYNPFTHTGILTTIALSAAWSVHAGVVLGSDDFIDPVDSPTFLGSVKWEQPDQRNSVLISVILGSGRFNQGRDFNNVNVFNVVYTHEFNPRLSYTLDAIAGYQTDVPDSGTVHWLGCVNYLTYTFTPRLSGTTRLEFFDDAEGQRTGFPGLYTALTAGLNFRLRKDIILRPELRYDYNNESRPFDDRHGLFTAGTDLILRW